jgi:threonine dehydrogenase-like Zn-dependent dehydrogenase
MVLTVAGCLPIPNGLDPRLAALTEPVSVGVGAVGRSRIRPGDSALVYGCGPIGLAIIGALSALGIEPIVASDLLPARRELATRMGAHVVVDPAEEPAVEAWRRAAGPRPGITFEAVGVPGMIERVMADAPPEGRIVVAGACMQRDSIRPMIGLNKSLMVQFSGGYTPEQFAQTLRDIAEGRLDVAPLVTGSVGIAEVPQVFEALARPSAHAKVLIEPALG